MSCQFCNYLLLILSRSVKSGVIKLLKDLLFLKSLAFLSICLLVAISVGEISKGLGLLLRPPKQKHLVVSKIPSEQAPEYCSGQIIGIPIQLRQIPQVNHIQ